MFGQHGTRLTKGHSIGLLYCEILSSVRQTRIHSLRLLPTKCNRPIKFSPACLSFSVSSERVDFMSVQPSFTVGITFCGDWAGNSYTNSGYQGTCAERLQDPGGFGVCGVHSSGRLVQSRISMTSRFTGIDQCAELSVRIPSGRITSLLCITHAGRRRVACAGRPPITP